MEDLQQLVGQTDIYLLDQVLRGRIVEGCRIFDAGCGSGRNLVYFLRRGDEVYGVDSDPRAIAATQRLAANLASRLPRSNFRQETLEDMSFEDDFADVVISSAVLHFAASEAQFREVLEESWRVLRPGGLFFCRLASSIGMQIEKLEPLGDRRFRLPDSSTRFLVDEEMLLSLTDALGGEQLDPLKTTVVQGMRCMTTWVLQKYGNLD